MKHYLRLLAPRPRPLVYAPLLFAFLFVLMVFSLICVENLQHGGKGKGETKKETKEGAGQKEEGERFSLNWFTWESSLSSVPHFHAKIFHFSSLWLLRRGISPINGALEISFFSSAVSGYTTLNHRIFFCSLVSPHFRPIHTENRISQFIKRKKEIKSFPDRTEEPSEKRGKVNIFTAPRKDSKNNI